MRRIHFWKWALLLAVPMALFAVVQERNSWRPKTIAIHGRLGVKDVKFSPDGRYLTIVNEGLGINNEVLLCSVESRRITGSIKSADWPCFLNNAEMAACLLTPHKSPSTQIYALPTGKHIATGPADFCSFGSFGDGKILLGKSTATKDTGKIFAWDYQLSVKPKLFLSLPPSSWRTDPEVFCRIWLLADKKTAIVADCLTFSVGEPNYALQFWDFKKKKPLFRAFETGGYLMSLSSTVNGLCALYDRNDEKVEIWNYKTGMRQNSFPLPNLPDSRSISMADFVQQVRLSPDGTMLAECNNASPVIALQESKTGHLISYLHGHHKGVRSLDFSPDGHTLASGSADGTIKLWRIK